MTPDQVAGIVVWAAVALMFAVRAGVNLERRRQRRMPFSWECPRCPYHVAGADPAYVLHLTEHHERQPH